MKCYFWFNGEILQNTCKYFQHFDRSKTRHDRAKIGLPVNTTDHRSKIILSPGPSKLDTRNSILDPQLSKTSRIEARVKFQDLL